MSPIVLGLLVVAVLGIGGLALLVDAERHPDRWKLPSKK